MSEDERPDLDIDALLLEAMEHINAYEQEHMGDGRSLEVAYMKLGIAVRYAQTKALIHLAEEAEEMRVTRQVTEGLLPVKEISDMEDDND